MTPLAVLRRWARVVKRDTVALYFAARHPGTPLAAKLFAGLIAAYALSPIDLIPDFVPVLGYLDDLLIVPAGIALCIRLIPASVMDECRARADAEARPSSAATAIVVIVVWAAAGVWLVVALWRMFGR